MTSIDYSDLADRLISASTKQKITKDLETNHIPEREFRTLINLPVLNAIHNNVNCIEKYKDESSINSVLDTIDLAEIYANVDKLEQANTNPDLQYDDFVVKELLQYFKHKFFKWVNKPLCTTCGNDNNVHDKGASRFNPADPNPDNVSIIEYYQCFQCGANLHFSRINNPVSLLRTREGRCGEWVNCFLLILQALIGEDKDRIRYVWNHEDHVWCEYYSYGLKRWVHLDPCEAVFDEPLLYCNNWGKKMSFVIGFNQTYIIDLSKKYITEETQIPKVTVTDVKKLNKLIKFYNSKKQEAYYKIQYQLLNNERDALMKVYNDIILRQNQERIKQPTTATPSSQIPIGRQTGSSEWTKSRGEDGKG